MSQRRYVYLNYAQQELYYAATRHVRGLFPRRTGKTHGVLAPYMHRVQKSMPRGGGLFLGNSRKQIMARTIPAISMSFSSMWGLKEGENFVFGKPPAKLNYPDPVYKPKDWSNTFSFANGFCWQLISLAVTGSANGITTSSICLDEAKYASLDKITQEVMPTLSGIVHPYGDPSFSDYNPFYKSTCFVSDASLTSRGNWLEKEEQKMDEVIDKGPNKGRTSRQLKEELLEYARKIIDYNDAAYWAKKKGRKIIVTTPERIEYAHQLREMCANRQGKFHILPNGDNSEANCKMLVQYKVLTEEDADLLFCSDFLITEEDYLYAQMVSKSEKYQNYIKQLRADCFSFWQGSTIDNIALLSEDYIKAMKRDLPPLVFAISILGVKMKHSSDGFYYAFDPDIHTYLDIDDNGIIDDNMRVHKVSRVYNGKEYSAEVESLDIERISEIDDCRMDGDLHADDELCIAADWNARINWFCIGTMRMDLDTMRDTLFVLNSMYVKLPDGIETLCQRFNRYYAPHRRRNRVLHFYYDSTAKQGQAYASEKRGEDYKDIVIRLLRQAGWDVRAVDMGNPVSHNKKYQDINASLAGWAAPAIRINKEKNEALIIAIENAGARQGYSEGKGSSIQKDKSGEKLPYNPDLGEADAKTTASGRPTNVPEEYRTDGTDALDSLYIGCKYYRYSTSSVFACG